MTSWSERMSAATLLTVITTSELRIERAQILRSEANDSRSHPLGYRLFPTAVQSFDSLTTICSNHAWAISPEFTHVPTVSLYWVFSNTSYGWQIVSRKTNRISNQTFWVYEISYQLLFQGWKNGHGAFDKCYHLKMEFKLWNCRRNLSAKMANT